jgi:hypothetical protein
MMDWEFKTEDFNNCEDPGAVDSSEYVKIANAKLAQWIKNSKEMWANKASLENVSQNWVHMNVFCGNPDRQTKESGIYQRVFFLPEEKEK